MYSGDTTYDGTIFTINFKVLDSAKIGNAEITILYEEGDICNYNEQTVDFDIVSGGITVVNGGTGAADNTIASTDSSRENSVSTGDVEENTKNTRNSLQGHHYSDSNSICGCYCCCVCSSCSQTRKK